VNDRFTQGRLQDIEKHVRSLDGTVRVLASVDRPAVRKQIEQTFADPRVVLVYRGVQRGLKQQEIADELKLRQLPRATQPFVSGILAQLHDRGFVDKAPKGAGYTTVDGWNAFNLDRVLRKLLKAAGVDDLT
jgi:hypothetical protein